MKYMLLDSSRGHTDADGREAWARLSESDQQAVYAAYGALNANPGVTPGVQMQPPETATTVRVRAARP